VPAIDRSEIVSTIVEMNNPVDKAKKTVGKENKIQNDLFGTLRHDFSEAFSGKFSERSRIKDK